MSAIRSGSLRCAARPAARRSCAILNGFLEAASQSISKLPQRLNPKHFRAAARLLAAADTIFLIARRRSFPLASYMAYGFGKMGIKAQLLGSPVGMDDEIVAYATPRDAAIAISFNPYAPETVRHTQAINALGVPVVAITDSSFIAIAGLAKSGSRSPKTILPVSGRSRRRWHSAWRSPLRWPMRGRMTWNDHSPLTKI